MRWGTGSVRASRLSLVAALVVGGWLVVVGPAEARAPAPAVRAVPLRQAWPAARIADSPGRLADGADYLPVLYLDPQTSLGTAATPDGAARRLVLRGPGGERELRRVDARQFPQFFGFTRAGDAVYWAESTTTVGGPVETRLFRAPLDGPATQILAPADAGAATFFGTQDDLVVADGRVYWAASAGAATEIRSVPVAGGPVTVRRVEGEYRLSAWPWLRTVPGAKGALQLLDLRTGARVSVPASAAEQLVCGPVWCRSVVTTGSDQATIYELVRTDGSDRRRVGDSWVSAAVPDVALLDRFEPLLQIADPAAPASPRRLVLYDLRRDSLITIAEDVGGVMAGQSLLWWKTGTGPGAAWHSLDLSTLD
ncbi:hypothetical protein [Dactylosporangium sp. CA-092794]|uniref:hypothetical protein n=1 Tax=Dactylosporangium sp. CA-092794 TaxID=3239929 RepID=UPI003D8AF936